MTIRADLVISAFGEDRRMLRYINLVLSMTSHTERVDCFQREYSIRGSAGTSRCPRFIGDVFIADAMAILAADADSGMLDGDSLLLVVDMTDIAAGILTEEISIGGLFVQEERLIIKQQRFIVKQERLLQGRVLHNLKQLDFVFVSICLLVSAAVNGAGR